MLTKVCARQVRETHDAYLLKFSFEDQNFNKDNLKEIYLEYINMFNWEIWLPKKICKPLSRRNGFYAIDESFFDKLEKRIDIRVTETKVITFSFSNFRKMFTDIKLTDDARQSLNMYLQRSLNEEYNNRHAYDRLTDWGNFLT